ncbi:MAG: DUF401 family protein [Thermodesulfovibrionales bacterium]|nr:DUF401 family protein [Thermodesulfovibrionales bacterium]
MPDILRISLVFVLIVALLRKKWNIGYVLLIASAALSAMHLMPPAETLIVVRDAFTAGVTIKLTIALTSIKVFELVLREKNILSEMMNASKGMLKNKKAVIISMPILIGMLPSIGGAYFSAPMVDESTKGVRLKPEEKGFINYWYRHPWEYILPLYPGLVLASAVSGIGLRRLILANLAYAVMLAVTGYFFGLRKIKGGYPESRRVSKKGLLNFIPIAVVLALVVGLRVELHYALLASLAALFAFFRYRPKDILRALRHGLSADVIVLIAGVMLFKEVMEASGSVKNISDYFILKGIPLVPMLFLLPFITGLLTGITVGFVGSTFPLLLSLMAGQSVTGVHALGAVSFAFASGFMGVMLSPLHVCFVLTKEYFRADMWGMYKKVIPASLIIFATALAEYFILSRGGMQ